MKLTILALLLTFYLDVACYEYEYVYRNPKDSTFNCYLKIFPETEKAKGIIVRDFTNLPDMKKSSPYRFHQLASKAGYLTLITNTSKQVPELFTSDSTMSLLDSMIREVIKSENLSDKNIFIGGISASGTRAARYTQYCNSGKSSLSVKGLFIVDSPLDLERFYISASKNKDNFSGGMLTEANWMIPYFNNLFGGGPDDFYEEYKKASVYTHSDSIGGNVQKLRNTSMIIFHEPDIDWWIEERGASYYDINSYDIASLTVRLRKLGGNDIELVTTSGKGFDRNGNRKPHSWSIVDEEYLLDWIIERTE